MLTPIGEIKVRDEFDKEVVREVVLEHGYENWGNIQIRKTVIDCGAHIGSFSKLALSKGAKVISIEPEPSNFELLQLNAPEAIHINKAISHSQSFLNIHPERNELHKLSNHGLPIETITLDELITEPVSVLKMDIEGAEYEALYNCHKLDMVSQITMEYHNGLSKLGKLLIFLENKGFKFGWIGGQNFGHLQVVK